MIQAAPDEPDARLHWWLPAAAVLVRLLSPASRTVDHRGADGIASNWPVSEMPVLGDGRRR